MCCCLGVNFLLQRLFMSLIHVVPCISTSFFFHGLIICHCIYIVHLLIYLGVDRYYPNQCSTFESLKTMLLYTSLHKFVYKYVFISLNFITYNKHFKKIPSYFTKWLNCFTFLIYAHGHSSGNTRYFTMVIISIP